MNAQIFVRYAIAGFLALVCLLTAVGNVCAEHQYINGGLRHTLPNGRQTPAWAQHHLYSNHPIGCGPTAWTIVYGYWKAFKGKNGLFDGYNVAQHADAADHEDGPIVAVTDRVAYHTETSMGQTSSKENKGRYGFTRPSRMCRGIRYALEKGYRHSRCWRVTGTEFDKFDHIKRYLDADRPVILTIKAKGKDGEPQRGARGICNHYVVIEKARKKQEKVGGKWKDRDVEYFVNYGWGNREPEWISVRQAGRNTG